MRKNRTAFMSMMVMILCSMTIMFCNNVSVSAKGSKERKDISAESVKDAKEVTEIIINGLSNVIDSLSQITLTDTNKTSASASAAKKPVYEVTDEEFEILCRIAEAEATDGTIEQKENVVSCVFARMESNEFPNTVKGVVFEKSQFSPISDGRYYSVKVTEDTKAAVNNILKNGKNHNYLFFCSYGCKSSYFAKKDERLAAKGEECYRDGIHRYYPD